MLSGFIFATGYTFQRGGFPTLDMRGACDASILKKRLHQKATITKSKIVITRVLQETRIPPSYPVETDKADQVGLKLKAQDRVIARQSCKKA